MKHNASDVRKRLGNDRHLSALKRKRQNEKRNLRNKSCRSRLRTAIKAVRENPSREALVLASKLLDKAAGTNLIPKKRAARIISRLNKFVSASA